MYVVFVATMVCVIWRDSSVYVVFVATMVCGFWRDSSVYVVFVATVVFVTWKVSSGYVVFVATMVFATWRDRQLRTCLSPEGRSTCGPHQQARPACTAQPRTGCTARWRRAGAPVHPCQEVGPHLQLHLQHRQAP